MLLIGQKAANGWFNERFGLLATVEGQVPGLAANNFAE
jgi:hypothetical protein